MSASRRFVCCAVAMAVLVVCALLGVTVGVTSVGSVEQPPMLRPGSNAGLPGVTPAQTAGQGYTASPKENDARPPVELSLPLGGMRHLATVSVDKTPILSPNLVGVPDPVRLRIPEAAQPPGGIAAHVAAGDPEDPGDGESSGDGGYQKGNKHPKGKVCPEGETRSRNGYCRSTTPRCPNQEPRTHNGYCPSTTPRCLDGRIRSQDRRCLPEELPAIVIPMKPPADPVKPPLTPDELPTVPAKPPVDPVKSPAITVKPPVTPNEPPAVPAKPPADPVELPAHPAVRHPVEPVGSVRLIPRLRQLIVALIWLGVGLLLLLIGILVSRAVRGRQEQNGVPAHIQAVAGAASGTVVEVMESRTDGSRSTFTVRIEPHADSGTQVLEEEYQ